MLCRRGVERGSSSKHIIIEYWSRLPCTPSPSNPYQSSHHLFRSRIYFKRLPHKYPTITGCCFLAKLSDSTSPTYLTRLSTSASQPRLWYSEAGLECNFCYQDSAADFSFPKSVDLGVPSGDL